MTVILLTTAILLTITMAASSTSVVVQFRPPLPFFHAGIAIVFALLTDYSASLIDLATGRIPSVLQAFAFDISLLSQLSLPVVQRTFSQSSIEHLTVVCNRIQSRW